MRATPADSSNQRLKEVEAKRGTSTKMQKLNELRLQREKKKQVTLIPFTFARNRLWKSFSWLVGWLVGRPVGLINSIDSDFSE